MVRNNKQIRNSNKGLKQSRLTPSCLQPVTSGGLGSEHRHLVLSCKHCITLKWPLIVPSVSLSYCRCWSQIQDNSKRLHPLNFFNHLDVKPRWNSMPMSQSYNHNHRWRNTEVQSATGQKESNLCINPPHTPLPPPRPTAPLARTLAVCLDVCSVKQDPISESDAFEVMLSCLCTERQLWLPSRGRNTQRSSESHKKETAK